MTNVILILIYLALIAVVVIINLVLGGGGEVSFAGVHPDGGGQELGGEQGRVQVGENIDLRQKSENFDLSQKEEILISVKK